MRLFFKHLNLSVSWLTQTNQLIAVFLVPTSFSGRQSQIKYLHFVSFQAWKMNRLVGRQKFKGLLARPCRRSGARNSKSVKTPQNRHPKTPVLGCLQLRFDWAFSGAGFRMFWKANSRVSGGENSTFDHPKKTPEKVWVRRQGRLLAFWLAFNWL